MNTSSRAGIQTKARIVPWWAVALLVGALLLPRAEAQTNAFAAGVASYHSGQYAEAARAFEQSALRAPAAGTLQNLGLAEWQRGRRGHAVLAWERALWVDPASEAARENLRFARKTAQLEAPELAWHEAASMWLPVNTWAVLAGCSLWFAVAMVTMPRILRWRRTVGQQALAAAGLAVFLLCLPSLAGVYNRARIGFVLEAETPLKLTPTRDAQTVTLLGAGQPARWERARGNYLLIRTSYGRGWVERGQFGRVCPE
jgi:tetratricopeptide (TPR) repeat protein